MKHMKRTLSLLLTLCMLLGCMAVGVMAADPVVVSARGSAKDPIPVYSNHADSSYGSVTLDVGATVSDDGVLTFYDYGTVKSNNFVYLTAESNNEKVATVAASYEGGTLKLAFTGVADGVETITVDYSCTTSGGSDSIYGTHSGAALGKLYYTVKVGTGSSTPVDPDPVEPGEGDWIKITNVDELMAIEDNLAGKYYLANDIDLTGKTIDRIGTGGDDGAFTGLFYGCGYTISNGRLVYKNSSNWSNQNFVGLFARNNGTIRDLTLDNFTVAGNNYVGAVAAYNEEKGSIINCHVKNSNVAGLENISSVTNLVNNGGEVGSVVGSSDGLIEYCSAENTYLGGAKFVGGLVGVVYAGTVRYSYTSNISIMTDASSDKIISNGNIAVENGYRCYSSYGGFMGQSQGGQVYDCFSNGASIKGYDMIGGFVGRLYQQADNGGAINRAYAADVSLTFPSNKNGGYCVGDAYSNYDFDNLYAVGDVKSKLDNGGHDKTMTSDEGKVAANYTNFDFDKVWKIDASVNSGYPYLIGCPVEMPDLGETFTVTFLGGGLEGDTVTDLVEGYSVASGTQINLPAAPVRTNALNWVYDFKGWSDGENTYDVGAAYTVTGDVTFTATWKLHSVNGDGEWTYLDAMTIMDYLAGNITLTAEQIEAADYNHDGVVSYLDAMRIMDVLAGNG